MTEPFDHRGALPQPMGIHTCHADCPCHTGGKPVPDFEDALEQAARPATWFGPDAGLRERIAALEAERRKLREALVWALDWIDFCHEVPVDDEDEPEALEQYKAARELVGGVTE